MGCDCVLVYPQPGLSSCGQQPLFLAGRRKRTCALAGGQNLLNSFLVSLKYSKIFQAVPRCTQAYVRRTDIFSVPIERRASSEICKLAYQHSKVTGDFASCGEGLYDTW